MFNIQNREFPAYLKKLQDPLIYSPVYIQYNNIATTICYYNLSRRTCIPHPVHLTRKIRRILSKRYKFLVGHNWYKNYQIMKLQTMCYTPPFSFVYGPAFTYLCIISHQRNASNSNFKENLGIQDILIHQKLQTQ